SKAQRFEPRITPTARGKHCRAAILAANKKKRRRKSPYNWVGEDCVPGLLFARFWETNIDRRTTAVNARDGNFPARRFHDRTRDGEAEAGPTRFAVSHKRLEESRQYFGRNANAGIGNTDYHLILHPIRRDGDDSNT